MDEMYPHVKRAVDYQISSDEDQNGIPDVGPGKGTTYDTYHWYGSSAFVGILWLAELKAAVKLAVLKKDMEFADKCEKLFARAQEAIIRELWNDKHDFGGYFQNYHDPKTDAQSENCFIAQLAGQWFADLMHLGDLLPKEKIQETLHTIYKRNIDYPGIVLMNDETTPEGDFYGYGYTFMQYDEVYFGCLAIYRGMVKEGLEVFRRVYERTKDSQWNIGLTYYAGGAFNGLPYYMTNPASLFLLEALSGWVPDAVEGVLSFAPRMLDDEPLRLPLFSPAIWVQMEYEKKAEREIYEVEVLKLFDAQFGKLQFEAARPMREVLLNGQSVSFEQKDQKVNCNLGRILKAGEILHVEIM